MNASARCSPRTGRSRTGASSSATSPPTPVAGFEVSIEAAQDGLGAREPLGGPQWVRQLTLLRRIDYPLAPRVCVGGGGRRPHIGRAAVSMERDTLSHRIH